MLQFKLLIDEKTTNYYVRLEDSTFGINEHEKIICTMIFYTTVCVR